ncbi:hypothetical protein BJ741DRAFT_706354 [Chytriomyces cf. hyalinus JEL632]|nr:hypothetical protein BJ741DRAFT_706354 [Chytriomyces cf. hyalinus JEL632]
MGQEQSQQQQDPGPDSNSSAKNTTQRSRQDSTPSKQPGSNPPSSRHQSNNATSESVISPTPALSPQQSHGHQMQKPIPLQTTSLNLSRSATTASAPFSNASIVSNASIAAAGSATAASNPVTAFSISLATCSWIFTKTANLHTERSPTSNITDSLWSHESIHSNATSDNSPPIGLLTFNEASATCVLMSADTSQKDPRKQLDASFAWKTLVQASITSRTCMLPLSRTELDAVSSPNALQNGFLMFLDALHDSLAEISNLEYNTDLSDQYQLPTAQPVAGLGDTASILSTAHDTLSQGLILTPRELKLLEYSVKKKVAILCAIVSVLGASASCILVRIGYEPRACNEVELRKADWVSLWYIFDDEFGYGLNKTNGQLGFINLGHLDKRRVAVSTQAPPLPTLSVSPQAQTAQKLPATLSPTVPLPSSPSSRHYIPNSKMSPSNSSYNLATPPSAISSNSMSASQHRMSVLLQMSASASQQSIPSPPSTATPQLPPSATQNNPTAPTPRAIPRPTATPITTTIPPTFSAPTIPTTFSAPTTPTHPLQNTSQKSLSIDSTSTFNTLIPQVSAKSSHPLRISERLASRTLLGDTESQVQAQQKRYNHLESELESLLSSSDGNVLDGASHRSGSLPSVNIGSSPLGMGAKTPVRSPRGDSLTQQTKELTGERDSSDSSLAMQGAMGTFPGSVSTAYTVAAVTPYSLFAVPPPPPADDMESFMDDYI